ncbi:MAG: hypothetical protein QM778_38090 [Myxococcales bacterium]
MASAQRPESRDSLQDLLRQAESPVHYDVAQGYARHQQLLAKGATLPEWAADLPGQTQRGFLRRWGAWLGAGFLLGALATWGVEHMQRSITVPEAQSPSGVGSAPASSASRAGAARGPSASRGRAALGAAPVPGANEPTSAPPLVASAAPLVPGTAEPTEVDPIVIPSGGRAAIPQDVPAPSSLTQAPEVSAANSAGHSSAERTLSAKAARSKAGRRARAGSQPGVHLSGSNNGTAEVDAQGPLDREEVLQLAQAEQLLNSNPAAAVTLVRKGNQQFKRGYLRHERAYIEVMALFACGRTSEGRARAQFFLRDFATSPYRDKVKQALEQHPTP